MCVQRGVRERGQMAGVMRKPLLNGLLPLVWLEASVPKSWFVRRDCHFPLTLWGEGTTPAG